MTGPDSEKMTSKTPDAKGPSGQADAGADPEWADGLKRLYDSVVDEPLPDTFKDLLAKLDGGDTP